MSLDSTIGGTSSNSYGSRAEFTTYINKYTRLGRILPEVSDGELLDQLLIIACENLDRAFTWLGFPTDYENKALEFPRSGLWDHRGKPIENNVIPQKLKEAQFEYALYMYEHDLYTSSRNEVDSLNSISISGNINASYNEAVIHQIIPDTVTKKLLEMGNAWIPVNDISGGICR